MARTSRVKKNTAGTAYYHIMSRTNDKRFLFEKGRIKSSLVDALKRSAAFSGIKLKAYAAMDNHFHVVCMVVRSDEPISESEERVMKRVAQIGDGKIFGSREFVVEMTFVFGERFKARHIPARAVEDIGYATHGWRLAKEIVV